MQLTEAKRETEVFLNPDTAEPNRAPNKSNGRLRILLVGNYALDRQHSMLSFAALMEHGLNRAGHEARTLYPPVVFGQLGQRLPAASKWFGYVDKLLILPLLLRRAAREADIVHICDHSNAMYVLRSRRVPYVVTCHDLLAVRGGLGEQTDCPASPMGKMLQRWITRGLLRADGIACDSTATLGDAHRLLAGRSTPPELLPLALKYDIKPVPQDECKKRLRAISGLDPGKPFILHVGSSQRRKNREGVLRTFAKLSGRVDAQLVIAGRPLTTIQRELAAELNILGSIVETGEIPQELLLALYSSALVFFFPSRFEGFGWPIIEAQCSGCPVICSNRGPLPEVAGEAALVHDVEDEEGFAADIVRLAKDPAARASLIEKGFENVLRYSPEAMIAKYTSLYQRMLSY